MPVWRIVPEFIPTALLLVFKGKELYKYFLLIYIYHNLSRQALDFKRKT